MLDVEGKEREPSEYELFRANRIAKNKEKFIELGLDKVKLTAEKSNKRQRAAQVVSEHQDVRRSVRVSEAQPLQVDEEPDPLLNDTPCAICGIIGDDAKCILCDACNRHPR